MSRFLAPLQWLGRNLGAFLLALGLALIVWVTSVINIDPNQDCVIETPLEFLGESEGLLYLGDRPETVSVQVRSLQSVCSALAQNSEAVKASANIRGLEPGAHVVPVEVVLSETYSPIRLLEFTPADISFELEEIVTRVVPIQFEVVGEAAPGFTASLPIWSASRVDITGRKTQVERVSSAVVSLDIANAETNINRTLPVRLLDDEGALVPGLDFSPSSVDVTVAIGRPGTFRDVTVKVNTIGQPAEGYRLTSITPSPQVVTLFSASPETLRELPGFVETVAVDLSNATDDIERRVALILPDGVSVFGQVGQNVFVQIGIAAIEANATVTLEVELIGLSPGLLVEVSPATVDVILAGPAVLFDQLMPEDVRAVVDLTGLEAGVHTLVPTIDILPIEVTAVSTQPGTVEVRITLPPTSTPTATATLTGTLTTPPAPTLTPTVSPPLTPTP